MSDPARSERDTSGIALAIVVVSFASSRLLEQNLVATVASCHPDVVVVVDCHSSDAERDRLRALAAGQGWDAVLLPDNRGFGGGMNAGVARARAFGAREVLLLNPDARLDSLSLSAMRRVLREDAATLVSPRIVDSSGKAWFTGSDVYLSDGTTMATARRGDRTGEERWEWISGACMLLSMQMWDRAGGFDEDYFLYWEDVDFSRRVVEAGGRLRVVDDAVATHDEGGTHEDPGSGRGKSATYYRYMIRNRLLFATKHLDADAIRRWRRTAVSNAWSIVMQGGRRQLRHPVAPLRSALTGLREGRAEAGRALAAAKTEARTEN